jgi:hypothetical protein
LVSFCALIHVFQIVVAYISESAANIDQKKLLVKEHFMHLIGKRLIMEIREPKNWSFSSLLL